MFAPHGAPPERGVFLTEGYKHLAALRPVTKATPYYPTTQILFLLDTGFEKHSKRAHEIVRKAETSRE